MVVADVIADVGAGQQPGKVRRHIWLCLPARRKARAARRLRGRAPRARAAPASASSPAPPPDSARTRRCRADPLAPNRSPRPASFQPRLTASCMPRFNPGPPIGECTCAASPTKQHPAGPVTLGLSRVQPVETAQRMRARLPRRLHRHVDAEQAADALPKFVERHRAVGTRRASSRTRWCPASAGPALAGRRSRLPSSNLLVPNGSRPKPGIS